MKNLFVVFFCFAWLYGGEYIISYQAIMKNHILYTEKYNVVKALTQSKDFKVIGDCDFISEDSQVESKSKDILYLALKNSKDEVLECLNRFVHSKIRDDVAYINHSIYSRTSFSIPPQRMLVELENGIIKIKIIKNQI